jgi:hypothetical protein
MHLLHYCVLYRTDEILVEVLMDVAFVVLLHFPIGIRYRQPLYDVQLPSQPDYVSYCCDKPTLLHQNFDSSRAHVSGSSCAAGPVGPPTSSLFSTPKTIASGSSLA